MAKICSHHKESPIKGYSDCVCCELEYYIGLADYRAKEVAIHKERADNYKKLFEDSLTTLQNATNSLRKL